MFDVKQTIIENWNVRELIRQKQTSLFLRLAASKDKEGIMLLAKQGQIVKQPIDIIRDPCVLEFLKIPEPYHLSETDLETRLIDHLQRSRWRVCLTKTLNNSPRLQAKLVLCRQQNF